jgi:hypothetical protein
VKPQITRKISPVKGALYQAEVRTSGQDLGSRPGSGGRGFAGADPEVPGFWGILPGLEELAKFTFALACDADKIFHVFDGLLLGVGLKDCEAADHFLGFRERAVGDREIASGKANTRAGGAGHAAFYGKKVA